MHYRTRRLLVVIALVELVFGTIDFCCGSSGITTWLSLQADNRHLTQANTQHREYITQLQQAVQDYQQDTFMLERLARERLHMAGKDEMIFFI